MLGLAAGSIVAVLAWALLWPESPCGDPVCVVPRMSIEIELDALRGTPGLPLEAETGSGVVSARSVLATAGIDVTVRRDQDDIPYDPSAGALDRADLYQIFEAWRSQRTPDTADARLYALITHELIGDGGESLFGVMFDYGGREGFAIAPGTVARRFAGESVDLVTQLQVRTFTHELLHALNRYHSDAATMPDGRLTLEAPTRCISRLDGGSLTLVEPPLFALAPETIRHFQSAPLAEILPGVTDTPFDSGARSVGGCAEARSSAVPAPAFTRWQLALRRLDWLLIPSARAEGTPEPGNPSPLVLELQALAAPYPLGYPLSVRVVVTNAGEVALPVRERLDPAYHMLVIETRPEGSDAWQSFQPLALFEPAEAEGEMLEPGARTERTVPIHFGADGWTFAAPGSYEIRARLHTPGEFADAESAVVTLAIAAPGTPRDAAALAAITDGDGRLREDVGRLLAFSGRIDAAEASDAVDRLTREFPDTALGSAYHIAQVAPLLRRRLDPATGLRAAPDPARAARRLETLCTDSGIAAWAQQVRVEAQATGALPEGPVDADYVAWDGRPAGPARHVPTYADSRLEALATVLHFEVDVATITDTAAAVAIAATLREKNPERIVLVGHADARGGCHFNDALALARARSLARFLSRHGVDRDIIEVVSLGERRPQDFAHGPGAWAANRRVEVLVARNDP